MAGASLPIALAVNFTIAVLKFFVGILSGSSAMISEGWHSLADTFNQILLYIGIKRSARTPDPEHPFGYGKVQFFWAFIVAILIFGISGTLAMFEGIEIVLHPEDHHLNPAIFKWNVAVLITAIILESVALRQAYVEGKSYQEKFGSENLAEALDESQDPVLISLLVEDSLALAGLSIALIGVVATRITGLIIIDGITSLVIGAMLMVGGLLLARENKRYLIGKAVSSRIQKTIDQILEEEPGIKSIKNVRTMLLGPDDMILALDLQFTEKIEQGDLPVYIDKLEAQLVEAVEPLAKGKIFIEAQ